MTADEIKKLWLESGSKNLNELEAEVIDLAVNIKIFSIIADASKRSVIKYEHDPFWGWLQKDCIFRSIVIDSLKLLNHYSSYLKSVIVSDGILSEKQYIELQKRYFRKGLNKAFKVCVGPLKKVRDKRFAHLENVEVERVCCNLQDLLLTLADLFLGLTAIRLFLSNPKYIIYEKWDVHSIPEDEEERLKVFKDIFETYPHINACADILKLIEGQQEAEEFS